MKLVTFVSAGQPRLGALLPSNHVVDLNTLDARIPASMRGLLEGGRDLLALARTAIANLDASAGVPLAQVQLLAPIPNPGKIICIGQNYLAHAHESNASAPPFPIIFAKFGNTVIAHGEPIEVPPAVQKPDYEGELAVVIGTRGREIAEEDALEYVAGYFPLNDVSARDWQNRTGQWVIGKTPDTFCPMGPALVTADEIPNIQNLSLRTLINGEVLQEGHTSLMIFSVAHLIADMSQVMTLEPGDVIATGTPAGIGAARTPPRWLRHGDVVQVEIECIGTLENPV
ncbi:MAG: fumarylacetoacetate hydrolase family protein, partial [Caldilineaceae bacterium]